MLFLLGILHYSIATREKRWDVEAEESLGWTLVGKKKEERKRKKLLQRRKEEGCDLLTGHSHNNNFCARATLPLFVFFLRPNGVWRRETPFGKFRGFFSASSACSETREIRRWPPSMKQIHLFVCALCMLGEGEVGPNMLHAWMDFWFFSSSLNRYE